MQRMPFYATNELQRAAHIRPEADYRLLGACHIKDGSFEVGQ